MGDDNGYIQFGVPGFEYSKLVLPLGVDVEWAMERASELTEAYREKFGGGHLAAAAVAEGATPLAAGEEVSAPTFAGPAPVAAPQGAQARGGGKFPETWPPTVVATTDDDGNRVPGCSYHKLKDGRQRPMRSWDKGASLKCTGKTDKEGSEGGFCSLLANLEGKQITQAPTLPERQYDDEGPAEPF